MENSQQIRRLEVLKFLVKFKNVNVARVLRLRKAINVPDQIAALEKTAENFTWKTTFIINKFKDPDDVVSKALHLGLSIEGAKALCPGAHYATETFSKNIGLNEGLAELIDLAFGLGTPTAFSNANGYQGVGDSNTAASATQTGLLGTNKTYIAFDATYPQRTAQTVSIRSTAGSAVANHAWKEYTVANGNSDAAKNLNRKVEDKGTKVSGETWTLEQKLTFA